MSISILILTLNEEINLPECLESVSWSDDIVVFDSYSTDRTVEVARQFGARVIRRNFDNYAAQRNAAITDVEYKHPWILMIDADERITPELQKEIEEVLQDKSHDTTLFRIRRKDIFLSRWLKRSSGYPTWFGRLLKKGHVWIERKINEEYRTDGEVGYLKEHFIHYPFNKGMSCWFERHNRYSCMEAESLLEETGYRLKWPHIFSSDPTKRREFLKQLAYRLPCRPALVFCYLYVFRMGFLDGVPGYTYCRLRALYEYMIDVKTTELRRRRKSLPV